MFILLVGKPNGTDDFDVGRFDSRARNRMKI